MRCFVLIITLFCLPLSASETVLLLHGFMRSKANMIAFEQALKKKPYQVKNWSYPSRKKRIEQHADDLVLQLQSLAQQSPGQPIHFVTHSMGGLIVRCALNHPNCPHEAQIGKAVLIAPPNRGSSFACALHKYKTLRHILGENSGEQLMTTPLDGFDSFGNFPKEMSLLVISGTMGWNPFISGRNDGKVRLAETCLKTPHDHEYCYAGHSWICYHPAVIKKTLTFLAL